MADYKFDGTELRARNGSRVGKIDRNEILDARGSRVGKIDRNDKREFAMRSWTGGG